MSDPMPITSIEDLDKFAPRWRLDTPGPFTASCVIQDGSSSTLRMWVFEGALGEAWEQLKQEIWLLIRLKHRVSRVCLVQGRAQSWGVLDEGTPPIPVVIDVEDIVPIDEVKP